MGGAARVVQGLGEIGAGLAGAHLLSHVLERQHHGVERAAQVVHDQLHQAVLLALQLLEALVLPLGIRQHPLDGLLGGVDLGAAALLETPLDLGLREIEHQEAQPPQHRLADDGHEHQDHGPRQHRAQGHGRLLHQQGLGQDGAGRGHHDGPCLQRERAQRHEQGEGRQAEGGQHARQAGEGDDLALHDVHGAHVDEARQPGQPGRDRPVPQQKERQRDGGVRGQHRQIDAPFLGLPARGQAQGHEGQRARQPHGRRHRQGARPFARDRLIQKGIRDQRRLSLHGGEPECYTPVVTSVGEAFTTR